VTSAPVKGDQKAFFGMVGMSFAGNLIFCMLPFLIGAMVDELKFSERQAGFFAAAELTVFACTSVICVWLVQTVSRRLLAAIGIVLLLIGSLKCAFSTELSGLLLARCCTSCGCALCMAVFYATGATRPDAVRTFGFVNGLSIWYGAAYLFAGPLLLSAWGLKGAYLSFVVIGLVLAPSCFLIPEKNHSNNVAIGSPKTAFRDRFAVAKLLRGHSTSRAAAVLSCFLLLYLAHSAIWLYQERIGVRNKIAPAHIGIILSQAMAVWGALGSFAAAAVGEAKGRVLPQVASFGLSIAAVLFLVYGQGTTAFVASSSLIVLTWFFGMPYILGLMSLLDRSGRLSVLGGAAWPIGGAVGSAISAALVSSGGYATMGWFASGVYLLALILVFPVARHFDTAGRNPDAVARGAQ
jgi:predicted MFS family arabinose efflux permease